MARNAKGMMPTSKIGYVELHRPGRWTKFSLLFVVIFVTVLGVTITNNQNFFGIAGVFVILPIIILLIDVRSRRRVLKAKKLDELATQLQMIQ